MGVKMGKKIYLFGVLIVFAVMALQIASAENVYDKNFTYSDSGKISVPYFVAQNLKYEPYPVSPGESFDLWIKVQNIGQNDAPNAKFQLVLNYPFSSSDNLVQDYGNVPGVVNALKDKKAGEISPQENQIVLKYRINVDNNADAGINYVKLLAYADSSSGALTYDLPISIDKTKTDFNLALQKVGPEGYTFLISNVGDSSADSLSLTLEQKDGVMVNGDRIFVIGKLNKGDFTKFDSPLVVSNGVKDLTFKIDYTDSSGTRRSVEKTVSLEGFVQNVVGNSASPSYVKWIYLFVGFIIGLVAMSFVKRKQISNLKRAK